MKQQHNIANRQRGFSLVITLSVILLATILAVGVMRAVEYVSKASASGFHAQSADVAAQSGLAAGKAWVQNNSYEAIALLESYLGRQASGVANPKVRVPLHNFATSRGQGYEVYLTDFNPYKQPMEFKLQSIAEGQGGARRVLTGVYRLRGLVLSQPAVEFIDSTMQDNYQAVGPEDAIYLGAGYLNDIQGHVTVNGSIYLEEGLQLNPVVSATSLTVNGDLLVAGEGGSGHHNWINAPLIVHGNYLSADSIALHPAQGGSIYVSGNAEFKGGISIGGASVTVLGNALFYDSFNLNNGGGTIDVGGNVIFHKPVRAAHSGAEFSSNPTVGSFNVGGSSWFREAPPATIAEIPAQLVTANSTYFGTSGPSDSVAFVGNLLSATINEDYTKDQTFKLSYDAVQSYTVPAQNIFIGGQRGEEWGKVNVAVLNQWAQEAPDSLKLGGFVFVSINNKWPTFTKTPWTSKIVLVFNNGNQVWDHTSSLPPTTGSARLGIWFRGTSAGAVGIDKSVNGSVLCNCFIYFETEQCNNEGYGLVPPIDFRGALYFAKETAEGGKTAEHCKFKLASSTAVNDSSTYTFAPEVMSSFQAIPGFFIDLTGSPSTSIVTHYDTLRFNLDTLLRATAPTLSVEYIGGYADEQSVAEMAEEIAELSPALPYLGFSRSALLLPKGAYGNFEEALDSLQVATVWSFEGVLNSPDCIVSDWSWKDYSGNDASFVGDQDTMLIASKSMNCSGAVTSRKMVVTVGAGVTSPFASSSSSQPSSSSFQNISSSSFALSSSEEPSSSSAVSQEICSREPWDPTKSYAVGDTVSYDGKDWVATQASTGTEPGGTGINICDGIGVWVGGARTYASGEQTVYDGVLYEALRNCGAWEQPRDDNWWWNAIGTCGGSSAWTQLNSECVLDPPTMSSVSPISGTKFGSTTVTFKWTHPLADQLINYNIEVGLTAGSSDLYSATVVPLEDVVNGLPHQGEAVYVQLQACALNKCSGWRSYSYTATGEPPPTVYYLNADLSDNQYGCDITLSPDPYEGSNGYKAGTDVTATLGNCDDVGSTGTNWLSLLDVQWMEGATTLGTSTSQSVNMNSDRSIEAVLSKKSFTVSVRVNPFGSAGHATPAANNSVTAGDQITVGWTGFPKINAETVYFFKEWNDPDHTTTPSLVVGPVVSDVTLTAKLKKLTLNEGNPATGSTVVADGNNAIVFNWTATNFESSENLTLTFCNGASCSPSYNIGTAAATAGTYKWLVPSSVAAGKYKVALAASSSFGAIKGDWNVIQPASSSSVSSSSSVPSSSSAVSSSSGPALPDCYDACVAGQTYTAGMTCSHNGHNWSAKYWTQTLPPGDPWNDLGACQTPGASSSSAASSSSGGLDCTGVPAFVVNSGYSAGGKPQCLGLRVTYQGDLWCNKAGIWHVCNWGAYPSCGGNLINMGKCSK